MDQGLLVYALPILFVLIFIIFKTVKSPKTKSINEEPLKETQIQIQEIKKLLPVSIYYGSQQGMAAKYSKILAEEGSSHGFITNVVDLNDAQTGQDMVKGKVGIFCLATHGEGDPTDNAKPFLIWLQDVTQVKNIKDFKFTVFGLGNTQYEHYNRVGKITNKQLEETGADRVYKYGEGDDNQSLEEDFNEWKQNLWITLKENLKELIEEFQSIKVLTQELDKQSVDKVQDSKFNYILEVTQDKQCNLDEEYKEDAKLSYEFQTVQFLKAKHGKVLKMQQLRQNTEDGSTLHVVLDLKGSDVTYKTAQNLGIYPENDPQIVQEVANYLKLDLNQTYNCKEIEGSTKRKVKLPFPSPCSVRQILTYFCDFSGPIMKKTLKDLASYSSNPQHQIELERLSSPQGKAEFVEKIESLKKTIFELIKHYEIKPSLIEFVELCPRISPRIFTIASSSIKHPDQIHLADSLLKNGLCSNFFQRLSDNLQSEVAVSVRFDLRESNFKLPDDINTPIIMIGPGTGVAPFIGFLEERQHRLKEMKDQISGSHLLYFGCRHETGDFIYKDLIKQYAEDKIIDKLYVAISRDQDSKVYVQDLLKKNQDEVMDLLFEKAASIYICGSIAMGKSVHLSLVQMISSRMSEADAIDYVKQLEKSKRVIKELW